MNDRRATMQLTPWYKQPGPWVLIALLGSIVIAGIAALFLVSRPSSEPTVGDYLGQPTGLDAFIEDRQRAQLRGISAVLSFSDSSVSAGTTGPVTADKLKLELSHPREPGSEVTITLKKVLDGLYTGDMSSQISAGWNWVLRSTEGDGWQLDGEVYVDDLGYEAPGSTVNAETE
ncbi:MAG: FixH family protein [Halioglobus sp.]